jgi:hypothetical protein
VAALIVIVVPLEQPEWGFESARMPPSFCRTARDFVISGLPVSNGLCVVHRQMAKYMPPPRGASTSEEFSLLWLWLVGVDPMTLGRTLYSPHQNS